MFPSQTFKSLPCPYYPHCNRQSHCYFYHESTGILKRKYDSSNLLSNLKNQSSVVSTSSSAIASSSTSKSVPTPTPIVVQNKQIIETKSQKINTKSIIIVNLSQPPVMKPDLNSKVSKEVRQRSLTKYYTEFKRIYARLLDEHPRLAHEHAIQQEVMVHDKATNRTYTTRSVGVLMRLKKRPIAESINDIGLDGEWVAKPTRIPPPMEELKGLCMSMQDLMLHGYSILPSDRPVLETVSVTEIPVTETTVIMSIVTENVTESSKETSTQVATTETRKDKKKCERCLNSFRLNYPMNEYELEACNYHYGILRSIVLDGTKTRTFTCCQGFLGAQGCTMGPHVFKLEGYEDLNSILPFRKLVNSNGKYPIAALDCEMSYTCAGMELTRVTMVDWHGSIILDELVKTKHPVIDLNTRFSGISSLEQAKYDLDGIHKTMESYIGSDTIIVGHGLENDLNALRLLHYNVIDTAHIYPHPNGLPYRYSLRRLCREKLSRIIQEGQHDSAVDALACIDLLKNVSQRKKKKKKRSMQRALSNSFRKLYYSQQSSTQRILQSQVPTYPDKKNHWWKSTIVQAWLHSFQDGSLKGLLELDRDVFGGPLRQDLMAKAIRYEKSWREQGTESTKALGQVRGSTRKPFPQKGRGKARVGTLRSPSRRGGYNAHGPRPHDKSIDIQSKVYNSAIRSGLATKFAQDQLLIVDSLGMNSNAKSELESKFSSLNIKGKKILLLYGDEEPNQELIHASDLFEKSPPGSLVKERPVLASWVRHISLTPLLDYELVVLDKKAVEVLEEMYRLKNGHVSNDVV